MQNLSIEVSILFLLSCILTARTFAKYKMRMASVLYSVAFMVVFFVLLFALDIDFVRTSLINIFTEEWYFEIRNAFLEAMSTTYYGFTILGAVCVSTAVQLFLLFVNTVREVVIYCFSKEAVRRKFYKAYSKYAHIVRDLFIPKPINLLYCRMLD